MWSDPKPCKLGQSKAKEPQTVSHSRDSIVNPEKLLCLAQGLPCTLLIESGGSEFIALHPSPSFWNIHPPGPAASVGLSREPGWGYTCICIRVCMCLYICAHVDVYILCVYMTVFVDICVWVFMCICLFLCAWVYLGDCVYVHGCTCMYVDMWIYVCFCIYSICVFQ